MVTRHIGDHGIATLQENQTSLIPLATGLQKPPLSQGSVFVYDNPVTRWEATGVDHENITWRNSRGDTKLTTLSMILPALRWKGAQKSGRRIISEISGELHPLQKGKRIRFREAVFNTRPPGEYVTYWECQVQGMVYLSVHAGTFSTWQILCKRNGREYLLLNYAPALGNNVRIIRVPENNNKPVVRQLIAASPMPADKKKQADSPKDKQ